MALLRSLLVKLEADTAKFSSEMQKAQKSVQGIEGQLKSFNTVISAVGKITAVAGSVYTVAKAFDSFARAAGEAEQSQRKLEFAVEGLGYNVRAALPALDEWVNSMVKFTRLSDEEAKDALQQMTLYTNNLSKAMEGVKIATDLAARSGLGFDQSMMLVGQAMNGNFERLGRYIPELKNLDVALGKNATSAQKWDYFMSIYHKKMEGAAKGELNDYGVKLKKLGDTWGEFKEAAGAFLVGPATSILNFLKVGAEGAQAFALAIKRSADELRGLAKEDLDKQIRDLQTKRSGMVSRGGGGLLGMVFGYDREEEIKKVTLEIERLKKQKEALMESSYKILSSGGAGGAGAGGPAKTVKEVAKAVKEVSDALEGWHVPETEFDQKILDDYETFLETLKGIKVVAKEANDTLGGWEVPETEFDQKILDDYEKWLESLKEIKVEIKEVKEASDALEGWHVPETEFDQQILGDYTKWEETRDKEKVLLEERRQNWISFANQLESQWGNAFANMADGTKSFSDTVKDTFISLADSIIQQIMRMIIHWMIWGQLTGTPEKGYGTGLLGMFSGLFGGIFDKGGIVPGHIGQPMPILAHGGEQVIPADQTGKRGGDTFVIINANDAKSFDDMLRRNKGSLKSVIKDINRTSPGGYA